MPADPNPSVDPLNPAPSCCLCGGTGGSVVNACGCPTPFLPTRLYVLVHFTSCVCTCPDRTVTVDYDAGLGSWQGLMNPTLPGASCLLGVSVVCLGGGLLQFAVGPVVGTGCDAEGDCTATIRSVALTGSFGCGDAITGISTGVNDAGLVLACRPCSVQFTVSA